MPFYLPQWLRYLINQVFKADDLETILGALVPSLRESLAMDRVIICQFESDDYVQVIAESQTEGQFPSLLNSRFKSDYLSPYSQEVWKKFQIGAAIDLAMENVYQFSWVSDSVSFDTKSFPITDQQKKNLESLGVQFSLIVPIFRREKLFGLLITYRLERTVIYNNKLELLKTVVEQLSIMLEQKFLRSQEEQNEKFRTDLNLIAPLLQSDLGPNFQAALELAVVAFQGSGGRLCVSDVNSVESDEKKDFITCLQQPDQALKIYTTGTQLAQPSSADTLIMEQSPLWQSHNLSGKYQAWPIENIYETPHLSPLFDLFRPTPIVSLLMIPLTYQRNLLGYLSIFRSETSLSTQPGKTIPPQAWDTELGEAERLGYQFSVAVHERNWRKKHANAQNLVEKGQENAASLERLERQQRQCFTLLNKLSKGKTQLETLLRESTKYLCHLLDAERVSIYKFHEDWGGEFVHDLEYVVPDWKRLTKIGQNTVWNDTYLQDTKGGRYRHHEVSVVDNVQEAGLSSCHLEILEQFGFKAFVIAPIFIGDDLWGLLSVYQQSDTRQWQASETDFIKQTASAMGLAMERIELLTKIDVLSSKSTRL